ncbi:MAG: hypothetical protein OXU20_37465 [Myxococcales bacterium]|nr:hypothetical protein [Myxococcales bacterium]
MANRPDPNETAEQTEPDQPTADAELADKPFRGELLGFRPSARAGLSAARLSAGERIRRYLNAVGRREPEACEEPEGDESC